MDTFRISETETLHHAGAFLFLFKLRWLHLNVFQKKRRAVLLKKCQNKNFQLSELSSDGMWMGLSVADGLPETFSGPEK